MIRAAAATQQKTASYATQHPAMEADSLEYALTTKQAAHGHATKETSTLTEATTGLTTLL
ncbi:MAG: hypothetical protein D6797_06345 [Bdellovibrio sp.]|nr:MAG: hypothetical protein D6797_06345 [Bdellovibrio sp.]